MKFPIFIAKRYLFSKKTTNIINIISLLSLIGVAFGTMAFIVVLSVFNGIEKLVKSLFNSFDPDLRIELAEGKYFSTDSLIFDKLKNHTDVAYMSFVVEESCMLEYDNRQLIAVVKAVDENFENVNNVQGTIYSGDYKQYRYNQPLTVVGAGIAIKLGISTNLDLPLKIWLPAQKQGLTIDPKTSFVNGFVGVAGIFSVQQDYDNKYVIVPLDFVQNTLKYGKIANAIEISLTKNANIKKSQKQIAKIVGNKYVVKNRFEQKQLAYKIMRTEKWAIIAILSFILLVSSFNIVGSLVMLIIEKNQDIDTFAALGADIEQIRKIFLYNGWMISLVGSVIGLILGLAIALGQQFFGWLKFPSEGAFVQNVYPVEVHLIDVFFVFAVVVAIGYLVAKFPVRYITQRIIRF